MTYALLSFLVAVALTAILVYVLFARRSSGLPEVWLTAGDARIRTELAVSMIAKARGLSYREELPDGRGMLFSFGRSALQSFWMHGMRFPIDMVWIRDGEIIGVTADIDPQLGAQIWQLKSYQPPAPADEMLELPGGYAARHGIQAGTRVVISEE